MKRIQDTVLGALAAVLFYTSIACGGQPQTSLTPTTIPAITNQRVTTQNQRYSSGIDSLRSYKPNESDIEIAEAVSYLQRVRHGPREKSTLQGIPFDTEFGIYSNLMRITQGIKTMRWDKTKNEWAVVNMTESGLVIVGVHDSEENYDLVIPFFSNEEQEYIERQLEKSTSVKITKTGPYERKVYPHEVFGRSSVDFPVVGRIIDGYMTITADKDNVEFSSSEVALPQKQSGEVYVRQNYPPEVADKAIKLSDFLDNHGRSLALVSAYGNAPSIEDIQEELGGAGLFEAVVVIDHVFDDVYLLNIDEKEMVEFRNAIDSYKEFKEASGFGTTEHPSIDPNLKSAIVYATIFGIRGIYQDPITAHRYAFAIARDPVLRDGVFEITYDVYFQTNGVFEGVTVKLNQISTTDFKNIAVQEIAENVQQAKAEISEISERLKQRGEEIKVRTAAELRRISPEVQTEIEEGAGEIQSQVEIQRRRLKQSFERYRESANEQVEGALQDIQNLFKGDE